MKFGLKTLAKLALFKHKREQVDPHFAQRLQRLGAREALRAVQNGPFRTPPARREA